MHTLKKRLLNLHLAMADDGSPAAVHLNAVAAGLERLCRTGDTSAAAETRLIATHVAENLELYLAELARAPIAAGEVAP